MSSEKSLEAAVKEGFVLVEDWRIVRFRLDPEEPSLSAALTTFSFEMIPHL